MRGIKEMGLVGVWREDEIGCKREEVLERKGKRAFERWENGVGKMGGVGKFVEEKTPCGCISETH